MKGTLLIIAFVCFTSILNGQTEIKANVENRGEELVTKAELMRLLDKMFEDKYTTKAFTIDHPVDPVNKVLRHFCMEGPEVWNVYAGNTMLRNGVATIYLPDYYSKLNKAGSEVYQLTAIGEAAQVFVSERVANNQFIIRGDKDIQVSWNIKVIRGDAACENDLAKRPVEQDKEDMSRSQLIFENWQANTKSFDF